MMGIIDKLLIRGFFFLVRIIDILLTGGFFFLVRIIDIQAFFSFW